MCGLVGGWSRRRGPEVQGALKQMTDALAHRGPDDDGYWSDAEAGIAIGHRRLAIVDLSPAGHQPMVSESGRWVLAFNGEIYNHLAVRPALKGRCGAPAWRGHSDTETMLAAIDAWGVEAALVRCAGMFAIALWDRDERTLWLARDRFGEKPLYYGWNRGVFLFGSELKALRAFPGFDAPIDRRALALYLRHNAVPAPFSIYDGIYKLLPGHLLRIGLQEIERGIQAQPAAYWSAAECALSGQANPFIGSEEQAADERESLLMEAVGRQMMADVPLGAFLSGGVDSSLVVALMQAQSDRPVRTFTIGFHEAGYNEAEHAAAIARHLGTDHTELYVTSEDALSVIPRLPAIYDEPFSDSSQIPTFLVAQLARRHVAVALSGDGGDELFGGYSRYFMASRLWSNISRIPVPLRIFAARAMTSVSVKHWNVGSRMAAMLLPGGHRMPLLGDKVHKAAAMLANRTGEELYRSLISHWQPENLLGEIDEPISFGPPRASTVTNMFNYMMLADTCNYMADDILVKVDRAAMACSLETRIPLLDQKVFEFAWRLPLSYKIRGGVGKHVLRQVLHRHVPKPLIDRPKMGFGVPVDRWLRGPLKDWAASLLDPRRLQDEGYLSPGPISRKWQEHQSGERNWQYHLWDVLMFQAWIESQRG